MGTNWLDDNFLPPDAPVENDGTGTLDNVAITKDGIRFTGVAPSVTGFAGGKPGRRVPLLAVGGPLELVNEGTSSAASNRIVTGTGADMTVSEGAAAELVYDDESKRWRVSSGGGGGGGGGSATVADDVAKQGGTDINRIKGLNRKAFRTRAGAAVADGVAPPIGGTWVYNEENSTAGFRAKKPCPPGHVDVENYGAIAYDGTTGNITSGTPTLVVSDAANFKVGQAIYVRGAWTPGVKTITAISGTTITLNSNATSTVTGALVFIDNLAAFQACLAACESYVFNSAKKLTKIIANGAFFLSDTLEFTRAAILQGSGCQTPFNLWLTGLSGTSSTFPGTYLIWPHGTTGLRFYSQLGGVGDADRSIVRDLSMTTIGGVPDGFSHMPTGTGHGIYAHCRVHIENVVITEFGGHGVYVLASNSDPAPETGNASGCSFYQVRCGTNGGAGFKFEGGDSNIHSIVACDASSNSTYGFWDESGLGNTFVGCHAEGNSDVYSGPGAVSSDGFNHDYRNRNNPLCRSVFVGCYAEQSKNLLFDPAEVIGGYLAGSDLEATSTAIVKDGQRMYGGGLHHINYEGTVDVEAHLGVGGSSMTVQKWVAAGGPQLTFAWNNTVKAFTYRVQDSGYYEAIRFASSLANWPHKAAPWMMNGLYLGAQNDEQVLVMAADTEPTNNPYTIGNTYNRGDRVLYKTVAAGGREGKVCVTSGTKGTLNTGSTTATTTNGSATITVNDASGLYLGCWIAIAGVTGAKRVTDISGTTITVHATCDASVGPGAAVSYSAPAFKEFGEIDGLTAQAMGALDIDWSTGRVFTKTLAAGANTITFSGTFSGGVVTVRLTSNGGGSTVTWPTVKWPGGVAPTQTATGTDVYTFVHDGTDIYGSVVQAMA